MKKRILSVLMVLVLTGVMITGCGKEVATQPEPTNEVTTQPEKPTDKVESIEEPTVEPTEQPTDEVATQPEETPSVEVTPEPTEEVPPQPQFTFTDLEQVMYAKSSVNVRDLPNTDGTKLGGLSTNQEIAVNGQCNETGWYRIDYNGVVGYVSDGYLGTEKVATQSVESVPQSGGEVAQQPQEQPVQEAPAENPYPLYTVIDDGGTNVYFYFLYDGTTAGISSAEYIACENECVNILNERNGISKQDAGWYAGANSQETNYYVDGKQVVKALPLTGIYVE